jgi:hypothetical protein
VKGNGARIDQIRHRPSIEIIFGHALLGKPLETIDVAAAMIPP